MSSIHIHVRPDQATTINEEPEINSDNLSSESDDPDQTWDDWVSDSAAAQPCLTLFDDRELPSLAEALAYDKETHGFDLAVFAKKLSLDSHQRIRLINYIRKMRPTPAEVLSFQGTETLFSSDEHLLPVLEDDPMLRATMDDWSDSDDEEDNQDPVRRIRLLEKNLAKAKQELKDYRSFISERLDVASLAASIKEADANPTTTNPVRDDDAHYFESYGENDIHAVMIKDKVRTSTYASFILTNPSLFNDAVVLDVGCGTGILSLFAARGGAKRVIAVDASEIAEKAKQIVKANGLEEIITVIRGKVEDIKLPDDIKHVDIIISEWLGYALLYESMLDSVLHARDLFLNPETGVMAPSQCQMMLGLCDATEVLKDRVTFWDDVYGFDMSVMAEGLYDDAVIDVVGPETLLSEPHIVKDLLLKSITTRELEFSSRFTLIANNEKRTKVNAFVLYFDTFFTQTGEPVPPGTEAHTRERNDAVLVELWPVGGKPAPRRRQSVGKRKQKISSFSTGPKSDSTHWKQTLFLLREPFSAVEGNVVEGTFHCKKSKTNSRELDVEIHYTFRDNVNAPLPSDLVVQMFKVR